MRIPAASLLLLLIPCCLWTVQGQNEGNRGTWDEPIPFNNKAKEFCSMVVTAQDEATRLKVSCKSANKEYSCEFLGRPQACRSYNNNPKHYFTQIMWELRKLANACEGPRALKPLMCKRATDEAQMVLDTTGPNVETQKPGKANHERQPARGRTEAPKVGAAKPATARPAQAKPAQTKPPRPKPEAAPAKPPRAKAETAPAKSPRAKAEASQSKAAQPKAEMAPAKTTQTKPVPAKPAVRVGSAKKLLPRPPKTTPAQPTEPTTTGAAEAMAQEYCWESLQSLCAYVIGWFHN